MHGLHSRFRLAALGILCCLSGLACTTGQGSAYRPAAPAQFPLASFRPKLSSYPEFASGSSGGAATRDPREAVPTLPPLDSMGAPNPGMGMRPVQITVGGEGRERSVRISPNNLDPNGMQPMEQLIYGGAHPMHDMEGTYSIHVRDKLRIHVADHPEFSEEVRVMQDGSIRIPNTDNYVVVQGLDTERVTKAVAAAVAPYVKGKPRVRVTVTFAHGEYYYVLGEVVNAGRFPMGRTPVRLSEAIFRANSERLGRSTEYETLEERLLQEMQVTARENFELNKYANLMQVSVITPHRSHPMRRVYNVKAALFQGLTGNDPVIRPGQIIFVPSSIDGRIIRFFKRVIEPIQVTGEADAEASHWYGRITGNTVKGRAPAVYRVK